MSLVDKQSIFTQNMLKLVTFIIEHQKLKVTLGEAWRPPEMAQIYAKEGKGIIDSQHTKRLAIDLNLFDSNDNYITAEEPYEIAGKYWLTLHPDNRWGGNFPRRDFVHYEMKD
jgi:hypothetical protein